MTKSMPPPWNFLKRQLICPLYLMKDFLWAFLTLTSSYGKNQLSFPHILLNQTKQFHPASHAHPKQPLSFWEGLNRCEATDHVIRPLGLVIRDHVACIPDHHLNEPRDFSHIPSHIIVHTPYVPLRALELLTTFPLKGLKEVLGQGVGYDDVQLPIVYQHVIVIQQLQKWRSGVNYAQ